MKLLSNMRVGARLGTAFGLLVLIVFGIAVLGATLVGGVNGRTAYILSDGYAKVRFAQTAHSGVSEHSRMLTNALIEIGEAEMNASLALADKAQAQANAAMQSLDGLIQTEDSRAAFDAAAAARGKYAEGVQKVLKLVQDNNTSSAKQTLLDDVVPPLKIYLASLEKLVELQSQSMQAAGAQAEDLAHQATVTLLSLGLLVALIAVVVAVLITRSITRPLGQALALTTAVADGDLTAHLEVSGKDEVAQLLRALGSMNDSLASIVNQVRHSSDSIATGSHEIAKGNADLSHRTEDQASNLQTTAASVEELTGTVKHNADTAQQANQLATSASAAAEKGGAVVAQVVQTMQGIVSASHKISDIIGVIDGIAFQTNILALNAAVEAARAGEQGRGFAVVANEVRSLAQRSAHAAKEIKTLIGASVEKVESGTRLVNDAGTSMDDIVGQVKRVGALIREISSASLEQAHGISLVSGSISQLDQVTQQNAALVEQSAAAADSLQNQAAQLAEMVARFKLGQHGTVQTQASYPTRLAITK